MSRSCNWVFTINNYTEKTIETLSAIPVEFATVIYGEEVAPSTGTKHLQGFICFSERKKRRTVERMIGGKAWLEVTHSPEEAIGYSIKDCVIHTNMGVLEDTRITEVVKKAVAIGKENWWLGSVFVNCLDSDSYEPCEAYYEMSKFNWTK